MGPPFLLEPADPSIFIITLSPSRLNGSGRGLFTRVRGIGILRTSPKRSSRKLLLLDCVFIGCYAFHYVSTNVGAYTMSQDRCELICIDAPRAEAIRAKLLGEVRRWRLP